MSRAVPLVALLVAFAGAACGAGCGGASSPPPVAGGVPRKATTVHEEQDGDAASDKATTSTGATPALDGVGRADRELAESSDAFAAAAGDCARLCKALASMQRATGHLCALTDGDDAQRGRCDAARARVDAARDKVKASCGGCDE